MEPDLKLIHQIPYLRPAFTISPTTACRCHRRPDCRSKAIEAELKVAKRELIARSLDRADGERFTVIISQSIRINLDTAATSAEMGAQWCDDRSKLIEVTAMRVTVNKAALALAA